MIRDYALNPGSGVAQKYIALPFVNVVSQTNAKLLAQQAGSALLGLGVDVYAEGAVTAAITVDAGHVPVGAFEKAVVITIGANPKRFKLNSAVLGISAEIDPLTDLPTIVQKAVTDNLPFSAIGTINAAAVAGQYWGAWRLMMDAAGAVSTLVVAADQNFATEADAKRNAPAAPAPYIDMGTISIRSVAATAFTVVTDDLSAAATVNYNGRVAGFVSWLTGAITPVESLIVPGVLDDQDVRQAQAGSLLVAHYTTDGFGAVVGGVVQMRWRVFPLNGEVLP